MSLAKETTAKRCFQVQAADNVATMLEDTEQGAVTVCGAEESREIHALGAIPLGHKIAVRGIERGEAVIKYGVPIGIATASILRGEWVHLHNCRSRIDERSNFFDPVSGAAKDTPYV